MKNKLLLLLFACAISLGMAAQYPANYYQSATGKSGAALKTALFSIISKGSVNVGYDGLFTVYLDSDLRSDGKIWDMYSNTTNYEPGDHTSGYKKEGDCYNREHSVPQSWFSKGSPMRSDAFHVVPTDGYVNNRRGNVPFGETNSPTYESNNKFSKVGPCSVSGYTGTIFEPDDDYKGDFARIYFYMATRYEDVISNWSGGVFGQSKYPGIVKWQLDMLMRWSREDPVSQKEIDRNNGVYKHQKNRNPFVDFPGLEEYVWGNKTNSQFDPNNYSNTGGGGGTEPSETIPVPTFSHAEGILAAGTAVTITSSVRGASIEYSINGSAFKSEPAPVRITIDETSSITARAVSDGKYSQYVTVTYTVQNTTPDGQSNLFRRVTSKDQLIAGREYLIVCESNDVALGAQGNDIRGYSKVSISNGVIDTEVGGNGQPFALILGGSEGKWTFYDYVGKVYLSLNSSANKLHTSEAAGSSNALWTITINNGSAIISCNAYSTRSIQYNSGSPRFACYTGSQQAVQLYLRDKVEPQPQPDEPDARLQRAMNGMRQQAEQAAKALR